MRAGTADTAPDGSGDRSDRQPDAPRRFRWHRWFLLALAAVLAVALAVRSIPLFIHLMPASMGFYLLIALAIIADTPPFTLDVRTGRGRREWPAIVSASVCFTYAISVNWSGMGGATLVQVAAVLVAAALSRRGWWRGLFDAGRYGMAMFLAGAPLLLAGEAVGISDNLSRDALIVASVLIWFTVFHLLTSVEEWLRAGGAWWRVLRRKLGDEALSGFAMPVLGLMVVGLLRADGWLLLTTLVPLYAVGRLVRLNYERVRQARLDTVTGLINRTALTTVLDREINYRVAHAGAARVGPPLALMVADLDRFKDVNGALGHPVGDRVLAAVAARLVGVADANATVARLSGGAFGILLPRVAGAAQARHRAAALAAAVAGPITVEGVPLHASCTVGVAVYPEHGRDSTTLLGHAEAAMYQSKMHHDAVALYQPDSDADSIERLTLLADLRESLTAPGGADIDVHFQPQVRLDTGQPVGVEALLRWQTPERGRVDAATVLHLAEQSDLMWPLTKHVLSRAIHQLDRWRTAGIDIRVSVNVSMRDLNQPELIEWLTSRLHRAGIPADDLQLEVTETALAADPDSALRVLRRLRQEHIAVSLDDFGTGYSSLARLRQFPVSEVKIDRSFVERCTRHSTDAAVVETIIDLAHRLGLRVVAEGVEDEQTRRMLLSNGCHFAQGWLYAPAMPPDELTTWLATHQPHPSDS